MSTVFQVVNFFRGKSTLFVIECANLEANSTVSTFWLVDARLIESVSIQFNRDYLLTTRCGTHPAAVKIFNM